LEFFWFYNAFRSGAVRQTSAAQPGRRERNVSMLIDLLSVLSLIPVLLAVAFMLWVFWNFYKQSSKHP